MMKAYYGKIWKQKEPRCLQLPDGFMIHIPNKLMGITVITKQLVTGRIVLVGSEPAFTEMPPLLRIIPKLNINQPDWNTAQLSKS